MTTTTSVLAKPDNFASTIPGENMTSSSSTKYDTASLLGIPTELKLLIIENLPAVDRICLKMACRVFNDLIPRLNLRQLLELERSPFGWSGGEKNMDRFACCLCLQLLRRTAFADQVTKGKMGKGGSQPQRRFCVQCGLKYRYTPGSHISRQGKHFVVCRRCGEYERGAVEGNTKFNVCVPCRALEIERATEVRVEHFILPAGPSRRVERRPQYTYEYPENSDEEPLGSPDWSDY